MPTEREELRLTVSLVDNASAGLASLRQNLRALGGGENREQLDRMSKQVAHLGTQMRGMQEHAAKSANAMNSLGRQISTTIGTLTAAFVGNFMLKGLKDFTDEVIRLDTAARTMGVGGGNLRALVDQMKLMGVDAGAATSTVTNFAGALANLGRQGSELRQQLMKGAVSDPAAMQAFISRITGFANKDQMASALNELITAAKSVFDAEMARTGSKIQAAELESRFLKNFGVDPATIVQLKANLRDATDAENEANARRVAASKAFNTEMAKSQEVYNNIIQGMQAALLPALDELNKKLGLTSESWGKAFGESVVGDMKKIADEALFLAKLVTSPIEAIKEAFRGQASQAHPTLQKYLGVETTEENRKYWEEQQKQGHRTIWDNPAGLTVDQQKKLAPGIDFQPPDTPEEAEARTPAGQQRQRLEHLRKLTPQKMSFHTEDGGANPLFQRASFTSGGDDQAYTRSSGGSAVFTRMIRTGVFEGMVDFKNYLQPGGPTGGGGGGFQRASFTSSGGGGGGGGAGGGGSFQMPGGGGLPSNIAIPGERGGGGGSGGGGAPNGSSVGPGTGAGAGGTPAGAGGAGGDLDRGAYDTMFKGTKLEGQYDNVVAAAQKNGVPPSVMAGIIAHETGKGTSRFTNELNNPAGLMDPKTDWQKGQSFGSIEEGIDAAGRTIGKNYKKGGGTIGGMAGIYAPPGAKNDPGGLNAGWASGVTGLQKQLAAPNQTASLGPTSQPEGPAGRTPQDGEIGPAAALALARTHLGEDEIKDRGKLQQFFASHGVKVNPATTAWCAGFVNANLAAAGVRGTGSLAAGSFTRWGKGVQQDDKIAAGDVGVVRGRSPRTGVEGSHVGMLTGQTRVDASGREMVEMVAGNEKDAVRTTWRPRSSLHVRRATDDMIAGGRQQLDRTALDRGNETRVTGTGKLSVDVKAPRGTRVDASGKGLFKETEINRQTQMEPAQSGPKGGEAEMLSI